jgi:hypothetical protein
VKTVYLDVRILERFGGSKIMIHSECSNKEIHIQTSGLMFKHSDLLVGRKRCQRTVATSCVLDRVQLVTGQRLVDINVSWHLLHIEHGALDRACVVGFRHDVAALEFSICGR